MKRLLLALGLICLRAPLWGDINVTEGSGKVVATDSVSSKEYQKVKLCDGLAGSSVCFSTPPVSIQGITQTTVLGATVSFVSPQAISVLYQPTVIGATVTFPSPQPISVLYQPTVIGATVTYNGTQGVSIIQPTVLGATVTYNGTQQVNVGVLYQPTVLGATVTYNGTQTVNAVSVSTGIWDVGLPNNGTMIGFISPTGLPQAGIVNISSQQVVTIAQPTVLGATVTYNGTQQVNVGTLYQPTVIGATVTYNGTQQVNVGVLYQPTVLGATVTFNGTQNVQLQTGSALAGQFVLNEPNVLGATITFNGNQTVASYVANNTTTTYDAAFPANGQAIGGKSEDGKFQAMRVDVSSNLYVIPQVLVSSNASLPGSYADKSSTTVMGDAYGRIVTMAGAPTSVYLTTAPTSTSSGFMVLVASPAATLFSHVCGCVFNNSSATGVTLVIYPTGGVVNPHVTMQLPATDSRGIWPGCDEPFLNTTAGGVQVSAKISASVSTIDGYCVFYQTVTP